MSLFYKYGRISRFGSRSVLLYVFGFLLFTPFVVAAIPSFIDFASYDATISRGWGWEKYKTEPISAFVLMLAYYGSAGAFQVYLGSWLFAGAGFFLVNSLEGRAKATLYLYLILNPVALVLLQFSRQYFAYLFFIVSMLSLGHRLRSGLALAASLLSHTASAPFSLLFYQLARARPFVYFFGIACAFVLFVVFSNLFFPEYTVHESVRGRGRVLVVVITSVFFILMSLRRPRAIFSLCLVLSFFLFSYFISAQAGRFAAYFLAFFACYGVFTFNSPSSIFAIHSFFALNILASLAILVFGLYGFG